MHPPILYSQQAFCLPTLHTARELSFRLIFLRQSQYSTFFLAERVLIKYIQISQQKIENTHHNTTLVFSSFSSYDIFVPGNLFSNNTENLASWSIHLCFGPCSPYFLSNLVPKEAPDSHLFHEDWEDLEQELIFASSVLYGLSKHSSDAA